MGYKCSVTLLNEPKGNVERYIKNTSESSELVDYCIPINQTNLVYP